MNFNSKFIVNPLYQLLLLAFLLGGAILSQAQYETAFYLGTGPYTGVAGGSVSGILFGRVKGGTCSYGCLEPWNTYVPGTDSVQVVNYRGANQIGWSNIVNGIQNDGTYEETIPAYNTTTTFSLAYVTNMSLSYDRTGMVELVSGLQSGGNQEASLVELDPHSVMNAVFTSGGTNYANWTITRGEGSQNVTFSIRRGDTLNTRTVFYTVSGTAVNGVDYTASPALNNGNGSVTINAGSSNANFTITVLGNTTSIIGTKTLTVTIDPGQYTPSEYQIGNTNATLVILPDAPTFDITAPNSYASPNGSYVGQFTITRGGSLGNSITANLAVGGTAIAGTDYTSLPTSIEFGANQTSTNLFVYAHSGLVTAKTVVLSLVTNKTYFPGLHGNAVVTLLPNGSTTNSVSSPVGRYWRGSGADPTYWSQVIPLDYEKGTVYSNLNGNCSTLYPGLPSWNSVTLYHYNATNSLPQTDAANRIPFNNPIVAFGERVGGTPLYFNQPYNFGIYTGDPIPGSHPVAIQVYYRTNYQMAGTISIYPPNLSNANSWDNYSTNGFQLTTNAFGLTTTLSVSPSLSWGATSSGAYVLTHTASALATNYYYVIATVGNPADGSNPMVIDNNGAAQRSWLYTLEFEARPPWRSVFLDQPHFDGTPLPPFYAGKTLAEILTNTPAVTNAVTIAPSAATNLDDSPELRRHPTLDNFVASMGNDPIALANYVINNIDLTDPIDYNDNGNAADQSINPPGVSRGALATFMEKQGSPIEQCALLIYLLRQAGVPAVYEFAPHNGLKILDARLSRILKFQVHGDINSAGQTYTTNTMIPVNYPWVAAYVNGKWVHIFPWLKDYEITEGLNLFDEMPTNYNNAYAWAHDYIYGKTNLLSLAVDGDDTPLVIFPKFLRQTLLQNHPGISVDDIGVHIVNRQHYYARWQDFPTPTWVTNVSTSIESLSSSAITNVNPSLTNVFDTMSVEIYSQTDPTKDIQTGDMRLVDLHNREFYIHQFTTNGNVQLNLILMPFRPNATGQMAFKNDANLLSKEVLSMTFDQWDHNLGVRFHYHRHRAITPAYPIDPSTVFLGLNDFNEIDIERPLNVGDQAAICLDYGRVTHQMLDADAKTLWQMESMLQTNRSATNSVSPDVYEGELMYLAGMSYCEKISEFSQLNQELQKFDEPSMFAAGLSKIIPARDSYGDLVNGTDPVLPCVDMFFYETVAIGNSTLHPDSAQDYTMAADNYALMQILDGSAEEHTIINRYYQQTNAVSTVRLLQLAQSKGGGIIPLTTYNYVAQGQTTYQGKQLQNWDSSIWQSVVSAFQSSSYVTAFITPGPMTNALYKGMGALIYAPYYQAALISANSINGGFGGQNLPANTVSAVNTPNYNIINNNDDYEAILNQPASDTSIAPDEVASFNAPLTYNQISSGNYVIDPFETDYANDSSPYLGLSSGASSSEVASDFLTSDEIGFFGKLEDAGSQFWSKVSDPVHCITGEFYIDETDLTLPGPLPLSLRRNYSSQNLADNQFGYGWKLSIMPYLVVEPGGSNVYAADMDGSVLDYVRITNSTSWAPTLAANPQLNNNTTAGVGGLANRLHDLLVRTVTTTTNYTLYGADGSIRVFQVMTFNNGALNQTRPYLLKWTDSRGNYYSFSYGTDPTDSNFGQLIRIKCSNGNYFNFDYDIYGHMIDAYTGDGRWVFYDYDNFGDLVTVTLPDGSTRSYKYLHANQAVTGGTSTYSTHLIVEEDKPDGRELQNIYDSQRRVTNQLSTAGVDLTPIRTATFQYFNNFVLTNSSTNTVTGYTLIIDGNGNTNRYDYTNSLITKITDPLGQTIQQIWWPDNATVPGYPRSVKERIDKRGLVTDYLYDSKGNVTNTIITGDITGDGVASQTATNTAVYNTNNLPVQMTDAAGNSVVTLYDPVFNFLPQQVIHYAGGIPVSTNYTFYGNATNVVVNGNTTQTNLAFGLPVRQIRAFGSPDAATNDTVYDGHGFPVETIRYTGTSDPNVTNYYFYNERGMMVEQDDALGAATYADYDALNRPIGTENFDEYGNPLSWNLTYYDDNGEVNWIDGPRYNPEDYIFYDYDGAGRPTTEIHWRSEAKSDGTGVEAPSGYNLYAQSFKEYDPLGNLTLAVGPRGAETTNIYNAICELVLTKHIDIDGITVLSTEGYAYEPGGQVRYYTNALGGVTTKTYTITGKPEFQSNPDGSTNAWRYYLDGRIKKEILRNGAYWLTLYDDVNRITTRIFYSVAGVPLATNVTQLDRRGNPIEKIDAGGNVFTTTFDGLDRPKITAGPAIVTVTGNTGIAPGGPIIYTTNVLQQISTNFYALADRAVTNINVLGEKTIALADAIGRPIGSLIYNASGTLAHETYTSYSADHNSVTVTSGSGASAIVHTTYTDNDGHTVLSIAYPSSNTTEFTLNQFDLAGNLIASLHDSSDGSDVTTWTTTSSVFDGLNRPIIEYNRDNALTYYAYDALSDITNRTMPGDLQWQGIYNNAGHILQERIVSGSSATRTNTYAYFASGSPFAGLLQTKTDGRNTTCAYTYDDWLHPATLTYSGSLPEQNLTTAMQYDSRGYITNYIEQSNAGFGFMFVQRSFDPYGQLASESVYGNGIAYTATQSWDAAGRRSMLNLADANYGFSWQADGNLIAASDSINGDASGDGAYGFDTAGLLTSRTVGNRTTTITARDGEGQPETIVTAVNGVTQLTESLSRYQDSLVSNDTLYRADFTDARTYAYADLSRRLIQERQNISGTTTWTNNLTYDGGMPAGPGVLTKAGQANLWSGVPDAFSRVNVETNNTFQLAAYGHVNGQATLSAWLDNLPVPIDSTGTNAMQWRALMEIGPGTHQLKVAALHPSGYFTAWATNFFTNDIANENTADTFDGAGNVTMRVWRNPDGTTNRTQTLSWDARGRLHAVTERDANNSGYNWTAIYDALNRRLATTTVLVSNGVALYPASVNRSYFDPQVEFLELGVSVNGSPVVWKLYGPDLNGKYGGLNGVGGLEGISPYLNLFNPVISDSRGNILAEVTNGVVSWNPSRPTGYGAVPGYRPLPLAANVSLAQASAWRGHWPDITGYYNIGLRPYDPITGSWLTYDSVWNERDPNYYTFCGGDPINGFDSDGRLAKGFYAGLFDSSVPADASSTFMFAYNGGAINGSFYSTLFNEGEAAVSPSTYINGAESFGHNVSSYYQDSGIWAAGSYALTSWNVGSVYSGFANFSLSYDTAGQPIGDWSQRGATIAGGVAGTAGVASFGLGLWNTATASASTTAASAVGENPPIAQFEQQVSESVNANISFGKGIGSQGGTWENYLSTQLPEGTMQLPTNFKTFDFWNPDTGTATSAKTLDTTTAAKLANPEQIYNSLRGNINSILDFQGYNLSGMRLTPDLIQSSELHVAVPESTTPAQWQQINRAIQYGKDNGVNVIVTPVK